MWWYKLCLNDFFFPVENVAAEKWTEKYKAHGIQAVNKPHGYSKNIPHIDILTEETLVPTPYSTTADRRSPSNDSFVAPSTLGCKGQRKMKLRVCTDHGHVYQDCAKGLFSTQPSCPGERELCGCHWPSTTILWLHPVLIAFLLASWTCIDLGDMWSAFSVLH